MVTLQKFAQAIEESVTSASAANKVVFLAKVHAQEFAWWLIKTGKARQSDFDWDKLHDEFLKTIQ